ncbi:MAG: PAS domain S-box protein [Candidatus Brocadiae bacterium]|nr:PAS domain S-box protein [Candidatus Brocadiia bacterium]
MSENSVIQILDAFPLAYAYHQVLLNNTGKPMDCIFVEANKAFEKLTGWPKDKILGKKLTDVLPYIKQSDFDWIRYFCQIAQNGGNEIFEHYFDSLGKWFQIQVSSYQKGYFSTLFNDVTIQKKHESDLIESRDQFHNLVSNIPGIVYRCQNDKHWTMLYMSDEVELITGYSASDFINNRVLSYESIIHPKDTQMVMSKVLEAIQDDEPWNIEYRIFHKEGNIRWVQERGRVVTDSRNHIFLDGFILDITDKKTAQERFELAIKGTNDGIWDWDIQNNQLFLSQRWKEILGYKDQELQNKRSTFDSLIYENDVYRVNHSIETYLAGETEKYSMEFRMKHKDGTLRWILAKGEAIRNENGIAFRMAGSHSDITERKEIEEKLKISEQNFRMFFESVDDTIVVSDKNGKICYTNSSLERKLKYTANDLANMNILDLHSPESRSEAKQILADMLSGKKTVCPLPLAHKDGSLIPAESRIWLGKWDGKDCILVISKDLSKEQEALQKFNKMFENNPALMAISGFPNKQFVDVNQSFLKKLGYTKEEVIGKTVSDLGLFLEEEKQKKALKRLQETKRIYNFELKVKTKSGKILEGLFSGEMIESQGTQYFLSVMTDISDRKKTEERLRYQSKMQELLMKIASKYINIPLSEVEETIHDSLEELGCFVQADRAYIFEYDWNEDVASNTYEWCAEGISPQIHRLQKFPNQNVSGWVKSHKQGEAVYISDVSSLSQENGLKELLESQQIKSLIAIPMMRDKECVGFIGFDSVRMKHIYSKKEKSLLHLFSQMLVNIRNRSQLEQALIKSKEKAESASKAKSEFLANMSHEIRTPLNAVIGFTDLLLKTPLNNIQTEYTRNANVSGKALLGIIDDILDFSKIEAGKLELEIIYADIIETIEQAMDVIQFHANKKNLELLLDIPPQIPKIAKIDTIRLKQILINLLNNAVKFTGQGEVELKVKFVDLGEKQGVYEFSVRDTGIGITQEQIAKLFKAFSQADGTTTRRFGGTGLGLVISDFFAQKMGSKIFVESEIGKGSTFYFSIKTEYEEDQKPDARLPGEWKIKRVLVVDDNDTSRWILKNCLSYWGLETVDCDNGIAALKALELQSFDLALIDAQMLYMDGLKVIKIIREKLHLTPDRLPIFIMDQLSSEEKNQEYQRLGVKDYLIKPIKRWQLENMLRSVHEGCYDPLESVQESYHNKAEDFNTDRNPVILIAEDVPMNMILVKTQISKIFPNINIVEAVDGKKALIAIQENPIDLILMDVQMPEMDGIETTRLIREQEKQTQTHIPIIALTAGTFKEEQEKSLTSGMDDFLTKPIKPERLQSVLQKYLKKSNKS